MSDSYQQQGKTKRIKKQKISYETVADLLLFLKILAELGEGAVGISIQIQTVGDQAVCDDVDIQTGGRSAPCVFFQIIANHETAAGL